MADGTRFTVRFWGVRGSFPTPTASHLGYGGNTSCLEITAGNGTRFIVDAGTGLRDLGLALGSGADRERELRFLITHFHWDHVLGLPFFRPLYDPGRRITVYSGFPASRTRAALEEMMAPPHFPVELKALPGQREYVQLGPEGEMIEGVRVSTFELNHPQRGWGYRLEHDGAVVVHACDHEHGSGGPDQTLVRACRGADLFIYDAQYTPEEYEEHRGWGHSTWLEAVRIAQEAGVGRVALFHHDPSHDDSTIDGIVARARTHFPNVEAAREGMAIEVAGRAAG